MIQSGTDLFDEMLTVTSDLFFEMENRLFFHPLDRMAGTLVDVGCGNGVYLSKLQESYPKLHAIGLEIDSAIYERALVKQRQGLDFHLSSYETSPIIAGSTDAILARLVMLHIADRSQFAQWVRTSLSSTGRLIIIDVDDDSLHINKELPLFSQLYVQSRKSIQRNRLLSFQDALKLELQHNGLKHSSTKRYSLQANTDELKRQLCRYMQCVTEIYLNSPITSDRLEELTAWLNNDEASHEIHMFGMEFVQSANLEEN